MWSPGLNPFKETREQIKWITVYSMASWQPVQVTYKMSVYMTKECGKRQVSQGAHSIYSGCSCCTWVYTSVLFIVIEVPTPVFTVATNGLKHAVGASVSVFDSPKVFFFSWRLRSQSLEPLVLLFWIFGILNFPWIATFHWFPKVTSRNT